MKREVYAFSKSNCDNENTLYTNNKDIQIIKIKYKDRKAAWKDHTKFFKINIEEVTEEEARKHE